MNEENTNLSSDSLQDRQKKDILTSAKQFFGTALSPLKGRDNNQLLEEFTNEMTLVAEGLSEDQERISRLLDNVTSQQTLFENDTEDRLRSLEASVQDNAKSLNDLQAETEKLKKTLSTREQKKGKSEGWTGFLRQATWLVAIASGAAVLIALINKLF